MGLGGELDAVDRPTPERQEAHIVINAILDAPGAVLTISPRPDNLTVTLSARQKAGPAAVFDPQHLAPGLPAGLRWSPVRACEDPLTAMIRATGLAAGTGLGGGGVEGGEFGEGKTAAAIQALLHAAALDGRDPLRPRHLPDRTRHPLPARDRRRARSVGRVGLSVHRGPDRDRPPSRRPLTRGPPRPATPAGAGRDRQPRAAAFPADAHVRWWRDGDNDVDGVSVDGTGQTEVGREPSRRDLRYRRS